MAWMNVLFKNVLVFFAMHLAAVTNFFEWSSFLYIICVCVVTKVKQDRVYL